MAFTNPYIDPTRVRSTAMQAAAPSKIDYAMPTAGNPGAASGASAPASPAATPGYDQQFSDLDAKWKAQDAMWQQSINAGGPLGKIAQKKRDEAYMEYQKQRQGLSSSQMQSGLDEFNTLTKDVSGKLANVAQNPDQAMVDRYYSEESAPIESNFYNAANSVSSYLARQGLGSSGMNLAAHSGLENNRSALEGQAKLKATDMAVEKERQGLLDEFSTRAMGMQPNLQKYGIDTSSAIAQMQIQAQLQQLRAQLDAQSSAGFGNFFGQLAGMGLGYAIGGPAGGAAGKLMSGAAADQTEY